MDTGVPGRLTAVLIAWLLLGSGCGASDPVGVRTLGPSRVPVGALTVGVWLPAGLHEFRLDVHDQQRLRELGVNWLEWLQPAAGDTQTPEQAAMRACARWGWRMPVYYAPPGYSPYDKLRNWAARSALTAGFADSVAGRIRALQACWGDAPGHGGYLVGHEDYQRASYPALERVVALLGRLDPARPVFSVGRIQAYRDVPRFLDAFFLEAGAPHVFQHEQYVFRDRVPERGRALRRALRELVAGYDEVSARLADRYGRWHAIVQAHEEYRDGQRFYRRPTAAELRMQVGLALSRGASGIVYFLYSSGVEQVRNADGEQIQERHYGGLVRADGTPTPTYVAARRINADLERLSPRLAPLYFHGGYAADELPRNPLISAADEGLDLGLFGDAGAVSHVLVVNRRAAPAHPVHLRLATPGTGLVDAVTGMELPTHNDQAQLVLAAGGFRLLRITREVGK